MAVPNLFANEYEISHPDKVQEVINKAHTTPPEGMVSCLRAMANRPDRSYVAESVDFPVMFLLGKKDNLISWQNVKTRYESPKIQFILLENAGHMGMIEEKELFCKCLFDFIVQK